MKYGNDVCSNLDSDAVVDGSIVINECLEPSGNKLTTPEKKMSKALVLAYGFGHFFNDLCAATWFTYLLIYLDRIGKRRNCNCQINHQSAKHFYCLVLYRYTITRCRDNFVVRSNC